MAAPCAGKIPKAVLDAYWDTSNTVYLSMVSVWEMQIKLQLGKLELDLPLSRLIEQQCTENALRLLPIEAAHIFALTDLPLHHKDPFDRLLLAQARIERLQLASADAIFQQYDGNIFW